ncbi:MAG: response regulator [Leptolyngbyaceae cyanobacterium SM1_3_5]|nr:response regulator [Leptolyngbyaceae cyanobacterium SM1_3_5]
MLSQHDLVDVETDEVKGWELARSQRYDLIVLDVELPNLNHISFCQRLRESNSSALILLLNMPIDCLNPNSDDYIAKPVTPSEVEARIYSLLKQKSAASALRWGALHLNLNTCEATFAGLSLKLTAKEYAILELFLSNQQRIYSQSALLERLWSVEDLAAGENAVRTHIKRLRQKLKAAGAPELLETVYGLGYRLNEACRDSQQRSPSPVNSVDNSYSHHSDGILQRSSYSMTVPAKATDAKVMILDDDLLTLRLLQTVLEPWGFQVTTLDHPQNFWNCLDQVHPDLLVLDVQMPEIDGIELCQIIRNDRRWDWLPILFLTGSKNSETIQQIFAAGADDYASKPVVAAELIARILSRLERTRLLRTQAELDPLTGLLNRFYSSQAIEQQLDQAEQTQQSFCFAVLELQNFKRFNLQQGYSVSDRLLRHIAQVLCQELHEDHIIAYWQCGEFIIGLRDVERDCAIQQIQEILSALDCLTMDAAIEKFPSIATSVVQYSRDGTTLQELYQAAIETLTVKEFMACNRQFS